MDETPPKPHARWIAKRRARAIRRSRTANVSGIVLAAENLAGWIRENVGPTSDWPVEIFCDDEKIATELDILLGELDAALGLPPIRPQ